MSLASLKLAGELSDRPRLFASVTLCCMMLLAGTAREAKAQFVGYYAPGNFTLANTGGFTPNGYESLSPDSSTLTLTGTNDGSDLPGMTEFTIDVLASGWFQFDYTFTTADTATFEYAGYVLSNSPSQPSGLNLLANTTGQNGAMTISVISGETIGFYVGSVDDTGGAGVLSVTDFSAPTGVPEPGSLQFILVALAAAVIARKRRRIRLFLRVPRATAGVVIVVAAAVCFTGPVLAQTQLYYTGTNVTGQLALSSVVNLTTVAQQTQTQQVLGGLRLTGSPEILKSDPRLRPPYSKIRMFGAAPLTSPQTSLSIVATSGLISGFNALSHLDQRNAENGDQFSIEPPNQSIAVGNGYVLEGVNDAVQIYNITGSPYLPLVLAANQVFGLAPSINRQETLTGGVNPNGPYLTDMRVFFDAGIDRWIILQRSQDEDIYGDELNSSHLYVAVSQTANPTANYNIYIMNTTDGNNPGCPCIDDYPQIGADQYGFHIAWNEFNTSSVEFVDAAILAISKTSLSAGASAPTAVQFLLSPATGYEFAIQPATTPPGASNFLGSGGLEYFTSTYYQFATGSQVAVWAMYNTSSLATSSPSVRMTEITVPTLSYTVPDVATQKAGSTPYGSSLTPPAGLEVLDGGDTRVQSLTYAAGQLLLTLQTGVYDQLGNWEVGGVYIVLSPTYRGGVLAATVQNQGYIVVNNNNLLRPALAVNAQGAGAIGVTLVGPSWYPTAAVIPFASSSTPSTLQVAAAGTLPEDGFTGYYTGGGSGLARWGDYNTAVAASDGSIWMVVQYIGSYPRTQAANWNTYVFRYQ
jgi:hypothetical protein